VDQSAKVSFRWYKIAAEAGHALAQYEIGTYYEKGTVVAQDKSQAFEWYLKSAQAGVISSQVKIAIMYKDGIGVVQNEAQAAKWMKIIQEQIREFDID